MHSPGLQLLTRKWSGGAGPGTCVLTSFSGALRSVRHENHWSRPILNWFIKLWFMRPFPLVSFFPFCDVWPVLSVPELWSRWTTVGVIVTFTRTWTFAGTCRHSRVELLMSLRRARYTFLALPSWGPGTGGAQYPLTLYVMERLGFPGWLWSDPSE